MVNQEHALHWIESSGGPLILVSSEYLNAWSGYNLDAADDAEDASSEPAGDGELPGQTDYDRACAGAVQDYLGVVAVDGGQGLVLGDESLPTTWWATSPTDGILVRWVYAEDQAAVMHSLRHIEEGIWQPSGITFEVGKHPLHLFDAAWPGAEASERLVVRLDEGHYDVDTAIARPNTETELLLHRFRRR